MLAKIRRMHLRDKLPMREIAKRTGLSRNTVRQWLRQGEMGEPTYPVRRRPSILDPYAEQLETWLRADSHRPQRDRRTLLVMFQHLQAQGYPGGYGRVAAFYRRWQAAGGATATRAAFVPLHFPPGEAFQFDWSCEYAVIGGLRRRLEVAHVKLAASRVFWLVAYPMQSHEMLFDAHTRAFTAFGGVPRRGIYDNMKTAVDRVGRGKERTVNARFQTMCGHYLFEPEFCNRAAGWEKGVVEKNVQDRRRQLWVEAGARQWGSLAEINEWLALECRAAWEVMAHPECPTLSLAEVWENEQPQLMPVPAAFDGYIEQPARVSGTALVHFQRNRYSVPCEAAHTVVSLRAYPTEVVLVAEGQVLARHARCFDRYQTHYDWRHYISAVQRKPGALRDGAPFADMPDPLRTLQRHLLRRPGGDRVMAQVLAAVPVHGLEAVLVAVELALEAGAPTGDHVLNVLARLNAPLVQVISLVTALALGEEPRADVLRYDSLRVLLSEEMPHVH
jgi:transposase